MASEVGKVTTVKDIQVEIVEDKKPDGVISRLKSFVKSKNKLLTLLTIIGVSVGFTAGFVLNGLQLSDSALLWIGLPGELYMRILTATILPLIISSVIVGAASVDPKANGRISAIALGYIILTNGFGSLFGLIFAVIIKPGSGQSVVDDSVQPDTQNLQTEDIFADLIRNLFPDNIVGSTFQKSQTKYKIKQLPGVENVSGILVNTTTEVYTKSVGTIQGTNILGLIILCALFGMAAGRNKQTTEPFIKFFKATETVISLVLGWIIWYTPLGVASLIAHAIAKASSIVTSFTSLGMFLLTLTVAVFVYEFMFMPLMYFITVRKNPYRFHLTAVKAIMTAFVALSTAIAIPEMIKCVENKNKVDPKVSRFVLPLAAALNRDGSALFICVTSIYICEITGNLHTGNVIMVGILAFVGSLAIPAIPSASIVTLIIIMSSLGVPPANIGLIMALEWFTDRLRSTINCYGCMMCTAITFRYTKDYIQSDQEEKDKIHPLIEGTHM
ncbi:excitatory amino acid transporter [Patella vulgata]|uniref:excitatory amino acid transporter n=1 Tax=Patella vulgata TaxID=6465 RepID=UPI00217FFDA7|nr:excitatory amino acid transporter [Patella vulgata]